ncbi:MULTISPECIES: bactofilin family protein [Paenibacillus]|uniref:Polymer-forming cytoskeletal protein n=1 Tax=Paenibacillus radicis (ex Xue et al. 2023) TaxID=2972489 RepID=A0ABT1YDX4_9BACL|nr:polymer-forming cytoskeletal protein [Paenibacillus radicis (ex Xue et al. 2023)]MCR8631391.1 polymer-forming cytoskeletal protein [Paenibacillus radicis (ex Xue et al. 2023)]
MFKGKKHAVDLHTTDTLIGEGTVFEGKIKSEASIRIEGQINGDVECAGDVTVGELGVVKSNIIARDVILAGTVNGNVLCKGKLTIRSTGKLFGNTTAQSLIIDEGGMFQGMSKMENGASQPENQEKAVQQGNPYQPVTTSPTWQ